jgi:hypothetical protein
MPGSKSIVDQFKRFDGDDFALADDVAPARPRQGSYRVALSGLLSFALGSLDGLPLWAGRVATLRQRDGCRLPCEQRIWVIGDHRHLVNKLRAIARD